MNRPIDNDYISKYRYYQLKYFCYQYHEWEKAKSNLKISPGGNFGKNVTEFVIENDKTGDIAIKMEELDRKMELVDEVIEEVAPEIYIWLKMCVVDGKSYDKLVAYGVPCGKEYFYKRYRLFFSRINQLLE